MDVVLDTLRRNPELALFNLLGRDYVVDGLKCQSQPIGAVLGVLLVGPVVVQRGISIAVATTRLVFSRFLITAGFSILVVTVLPRFACFLIVRLVFEVHPGTWPALRGSRSAASLTA